MGIHGAFMVGGASGQIRTTLFCCPLSFFPSPSPPLPSRSSFLRPSFSPLLSSTTQLLDVQFTSYTLAKALGIEESKTLIRKHLEKKFIEILGPVGAQKKMDAMQSKAFQPLDPTEQLRGGHRSRSQSLGSRRGGQGNTELLCPLEEFPVSGTEKLLENSISQ